MRPMAIGFLTVLAMALPGAAALAQSCDFNAESAAVVAAWGAKVRDGAMDQATLDAISRQIQDLPTIQATDPAAACAALADLKRQLGL